MMVDAGLGETGDAPEDWGDDAATFGDRLVRAREGNGLSQEELAGQVGVKLTTLRNWEENHAEPRANRLQMLAGMLNISMVWLMSGQGAAPAPLAGVPCEADMEACLAELRAMRRAQLKLAERMAQLERRLRASGA
ncbi:helix-turn-helix transcriptional regulator [soil metagenome]